MDLVDGSSHFEDRLTDQAPSLLTVILDTNPLAWALLEDVLPLSSALANLLVFINAHLASNFTNRVAVIASHCDRAEWLYPSSSPSAPASGTANSGSKYRPFRLVEAEVVGSLKTLLAATTEASLSPSPSPAASPPRTSTHVAGALTLALSYINRLSTVYSDSLLGPDQTGNANANANTNASGNGNANDDAVQLQSRILLVSVSPSADLAHQYIPIMNAIFACQRLHIPIDILQVGLPSPSTTVDTAAAEESPTVFLQQASDATAGIFIPMALAGGDGAKEVNAQSLLTYLLSAFVTSPSTRAHLTPPTAINVDFRAACFCHRRVVDLGYVCSICLSIFCQVPAAAACLTCGNQLQVDPAYSKRPVVVAVAKKKKKKKHATPTATTTATTTPDNQ